MSHSIVLHVVTCTKSTSILSVICIIFFFFGGAVNFQLGMDLEHASVGYYALLNRSKKYYIEILMDSTSNR